MFMEINTIKQVLRVKAVYVEKISCSRSGLNGSFEINPRLTFHVLRPNESKLLKVVCNMVISSSPRPTPFDISLEMIGEYKVNDLNIIDSSSDKEIVEAVGDIILAEASLVVSFITSSMSMIPFVIPPCVPEEYQVK